MMGRDAGPRLLDPVERVPRDDRLVGIVLGPAARGGAEFGGQGREPAGEPGRQQVRAVGEPRRAYPVEQVVGPGEQGLACCLRVGASPVPPTVTRSIPVTTADASAAHEVSAADGRTAPPNRVSILISASRATWASSAARARPSRRRARPPPGPAG